MTGGRAFIATAFRVLAGLTFVATGFMKLSGPAFFAEAFGSMGIPSSFVTILLLGLLEFVGGLMLLAGLGTRLAALGLSIVMIGASIVNALLFLVALPVTIVLFGFMVYLLWAGPGAFAVDNRLAGRFTRAAHQAG
ncbi:DoxX family protein [Pseudonocardia acaciae]|uniref:DoxX family protein n=1 Tax=Pseudonocardia acaciae TaxID=551276 RepID=UPI0014705B43|nr:DoxX family membrane protein [Pseudonocardia acaciae]